MISIVRLSKDIPHQMKILNNYTYPASHSMNCEIINDVKLFPTELSQIYDVIQSDIALQNQVH